MADVLSQCGLRAAADSLTAVLSEAQELLRFARQARRSRRRDDVPVREVTMSEEDHAAVVLYIAMLDFDKQLESQVGPFK